MSIHHLFYPRSVAAVGSVSRGKVGYELIRQMLEGGHTNLYAANTNVAGGQLPRA